MNVSDEGLRPNENFCVFLPTIDSWNIGLDVSVAMGSSRLRTLTAGLGDLKHFRRMVLSGIRAY
jgi:hypothetical protein